MGFDGRLTPAVGSPYPAEAAGPFGSQFSPTDPHHLYVSNAHGGAGNGSVSAFSVNPNAKVKTIGGSPFADGQTAPCWVEISHEAATCSLSTRAVRPSRATRSFRTVRCSCSRARHSAAGRGTAVRRPARRER